MSAANQLTGRCPICESDPGEILNVGCEHFAVCHEHKLFWHVGSNLFSGWRDEGPEVWERNKKLLATYTDRKDRRKIGTDSQIDNMAMQDEVGRMFAKMPIPPWATTAASKPPPWVTPVKRVRQPILNEVGFTRHRPLMQTQEQYLDGLVADHVLKGVTRFTVFSHQYWYGTGETDSFDVNYRAAINAMEACDAIELNIADGVSPALAIAALRAICTELEGMDSLEPFTPRLPGGAK